MDPHRHLFRNLHGTLGHASTTIQVTPVLAELSGSDPSRALERLGSSPDGLSAEEAARRLQQHGANAVVGDAGHTRARIFLRACLNPLVLLLGVLATVSALTGDVRAALMMSGRSCSVSCCASRRTLARARRRPGASPFLPRSVAFRLAGRGAATGWTRRIAGTTDAPLPA